MPNYWRLVVWLEDDGDLSEFMHWLTAGARSARMPPKHGAVTGPLYQGRFKAFPIAEDDHLLAVLRFVERHPLRPGLVTRAGKWRWSSLGRGSRQLAGPPLEVRSSKCLYQSFMKEIAQMGCHIDLVTETYNEPNQSFHHA